MDLTLFTALLQNLLHMQVLTTDGQEDAFKAIEERYCYNPALQPALTAEALAHMYGEMSDDNIYGFQDELGICMEFFRICGKTFWLGPFVRREFNDARVEAALIAHHMTAAYTASIRLYYSGFPIIGFSHVISVTLAVIQSFSGVKREFIYVPVSSTEEQVSLPASERSERLDYSSLYRRYALENQFLHMIETGDVENVMNASKQMTWEGLTQNRYISTVYQDSAVGQSMLRALARKAAERGGASLVEIHAITQRHVQEFADVQRHVSNASMQSITANMILALTQAVRDSQTRYGSYSAPIRQVAEYIYHNFSQELTLGELAELSHLSESYLSRTFKREVGCTIFQYIAQLRCQHAAELLRSTDRPIQEISSYVGYEDNNYFVKVFRKQYGMTPSAYRAGK